MLSVLPAMKAPTVSELAGGGGYAVETVVPKSEVNILIPALKDRGASDIIELASVEDRALMTQARRGPRMPVCGVVTQFDDDRGLGTVRADDGRSLDFHCAAMADGSRYIAVGTRGGVLRGPGHGGRNEARHVAGLEPA